MADNTKRTLVGSILIVAVLGIGLLFVDLYLHKRFDDMAAYNRRGYRGAVLGTKKSGEVRIAMFGDSTVFGYDLRPSESLPSWLEKKLQSRSNTNGNAHWSVANLGHVASGACTFPTNLKTFDYLESDLTVFYGGYVDRENVNMANPLLESPIFALTGYFPIFPLIFREKAMLLRYGKNLEGAYLPKQTVVMSNLKEQMQAAVLESTADLSDKLTGQLKKVAGAKAVETTVLSIGQEQKWQHYCECMRQSIDYVLKQNRAVLVATSPYLDQNYRDQQVVLRKMLEANYKNDKKVTYLNLGDAIDLNDRSLSFDGMHLTAKGNEKISELFIAPIENLLLKHTKVAAFTE